MNTPSPAVPAKATLDEASLAKLRQLDPEGKAGVLMRVFAAYERTLLQFLHQLREQLEQPNTQVVARAAHTIRSSSASVGALALARLCEVQERYLRAGGAAQTHDVQHLIEEAEAVLATVRAMLGR